MTANRTDDKKNTKRMLIRLIKVLNVLMIAFAFYLCWKHYYSRHILRPFFRKGNYVIVALFAILYYLIAHLYQGFLIQLQKKTELIYSQIMAVLCSDGIMFIVLVLLKRSMQNIVPLFLAFILQVIMIVLWCTLAHNWYFANNEAKRTVIIYKENTSLKAQMEKNNMQHYFNIVDSVPFDQAVKALGEGTLDAEVVFLDALQSSDRNVIVKECIRNNILVYTSPGITDTVISGADMMSLFHQPFLFIHGYDPTPEYLFIKRSMDIILSLAALIILSPLMIIIALIIKKDGGTAFYKQKRLTKDGKEFNVLKFRSMRMDAEKDGVARLSTGDHDDRITPIGRFIRKVRIDELPQLINILKGDMSIVGPRPERPEIARQYLETLPEFNLRLQAKCGLTGYAQVYGKYNSTPYEKLLMDLIYISKPSIFEDIKIILATIKILFVPESTEGVEEGQTTAMSSKDPLQ